MSLRAGLILAFSALTIAASCAKGGTVQEPTGTGGGSGGKGGAATSVSTTTGTAGGGGGTGGSGGANPCEGVTCHTPPANVCADASKLTVFDANGTCAQGTCSYGSHEETCPNGCAAGSCSGDPCIGVTCSSPPANVCADATHVTVYDAAGACNGGACAYGSHQEFCPNGCANGACNGDPCIGVSCNAPPANYCSGANELTVYEVPGACTAGSCNYQKHTEFCAFGCVAGMCSGDPCVGVSCTTPPATYCSGPSTKRVYNPTGACSGGTCSYTYTDQACAHGCVNGVCLECMATADCPAGKWCNGNTCAACNDDQHCGTSCANCAASGDVCNAASTACVDCVIDAQCGAGEWCNANVCSGCGDAQHCGPSCVTCSGTTPSCNGTSCVCSGASCGAYNQCAGGACVECNTNAACGSACAACGGTTPLCLDEGATSKCVQCLSNTDCVAPKVCAAATKTCVDACTLPTNACANGTQNRNGCANARVIGRSVAGSAAGFSISDDTCSASDSFDDSSSCWDANSDHAYRIFMRKNESIQITLETGWDCPYNWSFWYATLKIFSNGGCTDTACTNKVFCDYNETDYSQPFTAPQDGWYILVVDGSSAFDDEGDYTFKVKLTCNTSGCEC